MLTKLSKNLKLPPVVERINAIFKKNHFDFFLVGGFVRDYLIGKQQGDMDFTTQAQPEEINQLFTGQTEVKVIPTGIKHGTVTLVTPQEKIEITTYRLDGRYLDNRHPEKIQFSSSLEEDLKRRDFTINALVYDLDRKTILDYHHGLDDLKNRRIRSIGNPEERFQEDALRMLRACRFASQLGFKVETPTFLALKKRSPNIKLISIERVRDELIKMLTGFLPATHNAPAEGVDLLKESGLLHFILPELEETVGVKQNHHHHHDVYRHTLIALNGLKLYGDYDHQLAMATLLHDIAKPQTKEIHPQTGEPTFYNHEIVGMMMAKKILKRLKFSNHEITTITHLIRHHMFHYLPEWKDVTVRRFIRKIGFDHLNQLFHLVKTDRLAKHWNGLQLPPDQEDHHDLEEIAFRIETIRKNDDCLSVKELKINGSTLIQEFGLTPGPQIGKILNHLLEEVIKSPNQNNFDTLSKLTEDFLNRKV